MIKAIVTVEIESTDTDTGNHDRKGTVMFSYPEPGNGVYTTEKETAIIHAITGGSKNNMWHSVTARPDLIEDTQVYDVHYGYNSGD